MKIRLAETYPGEFDESPDVLLERALDVATQAVHEMLTKGFRSHDKMPSVGDRVRNTNPKCIHYKSEGLVIRLVDLPKGAGKAIRYKCTNSGPEWSVGDTLEKTPDQLSPMKKSLSKGHSVPEAVRRAAKRGLELRRKQPPSGKAGLSIKEASKQGIGSGVARARDLMGGEVSEETIRRMNAYFSRHASNYKLDAGKKPHEDKGYVAGLLWEARQAKPGRLAWYANSIL